MVWSKITALVLAIISLFLAITVYGSGLTLYIAPLAIIFGIVALVLTSKYNTENSENPESKTMATVSIILSSIALVIAIIILIIRVVFAGAYSIGSNNSSYDDYDWSETEYCDGTISVGESTDCGDLEIEFDDLNQDGNTYTVTYTITNNGYSDYEFDKGYDPVIEYDDYDLDFANEEGTVTIESDSEKQIESTFEAVDGKTVTDIEIELEDGFIFLEV